jgi:hypothetical protein
MRNITFITEVDYDLIVSRETKQETTPINQINTRNLRRKDRKNIPRGIELFPLYLQEKRELDFI